MVRNILVCGTTEKLIHSGGSFWRMAMCTRVSGRMIKRMAMVSTSMQMERITKETGSMISSRVMARKNGLIKAVTLESTRMGRRMVRESLLGQMGLRMKESGRTTKCMGKVCSYGRMEEGTMESTRMIGNMAKVRSIGQTGGSVKDSGGMESRSETTLINPLARMSKVIETRLGITLNDTYI